MGASRFFRGNLTPNARHITQDFACAFPNQTKFIMQACEPGAAGGSWEFFTIANSNVANTFTAKTAIPATLTTQGLTLTAVVNSSGTNGAAGNSISLTLVGGGTAGAEVVTVVGTAITVQIESGVSTVTQVRTAMQASAACTALVTTTGTSASTVNSALIQNLAGGADSQFNLTNGVITSTTVSGTQFPGQLGRLTISAGTLPTGLALATDYFTYFANSTYNGTNYGSPTQFQLFSSVNSLNAARQKYRNGLAPVGTPGLVIPTTDGTAGSTMTYTPITISVATITAQMSNDFQASPNPVDLNSLVGTNVPNIVNNNLTNPVNFVNMPTNLMYDAANNVAVGAVGIYELTYRANTAKYVRLNLTFNAGSLICRCIGYNS